MRTVKEMQDDIRRLFDPKAAHPFDKLWQWAKEGESRRLRQRRFKALQLWAQGNRQNASGAERERWDARRKQYARKKRQIARRRISRNPDVPDLGTGPWGGSESVAEATVLQEFVEHGIAPTSTKRWETFGNPGSDHYMGNTTAYAIDGAIANWQSGHAAIGQRFAQVGMPLSSAPSDYELCYATAPNGARFRYQGIAATHGTGPHYHGGVRRA